MKAVIMVTTLPSRREASNIATMMVQKGFAACVSLFPVRSIYMWEGNLEDDDEVMLIVKTSEEKVSELKGWIKEVHPYQVPEILVINVSDVGADYLNWMEMVLAGKR